MVRIIGSSMFSIPEQCARRQAHSKVSLRLLRLKTSYRSRREHVNWSIHPSQWIERAPRKARFHQRCEDRCNPQVPPVFAQPAFLRMPSISLDVNPGSVWKETLPSFPTVLARGAIVSSLGASSIATRSYWPSVQRKLLILAPIFDAASEKAAARLVVSLTLRMP